MPRLYISAAHKSSGKTICTMALAAALKTRGRRVQTFKKGPDYIDPMWLARAATRDCHNLDFHTMSDGEICELFAVYDHQADMSLIEGTKGLHDSVDTEGRFSNASLANLLETPVVLVIDTRGMTRGIAALLRGLVEFDPKVEFAGVVLNQVGGGRHEAKLRNAIERYTDLAVLGAMPPHHSLVIPQAYLGLVPANEAGEGEPVIEAMARVASEHLELDQILAAGERARPLSATLPCHGPEPEPVCRLRLGVARDEAFGFYYPGDLASIRAAGAELVPIDTLRDTALPVIDGLFLGGGFPERHMQVLAANHGMRSAIRDAVEAGLPVYAECGGLMYLARQLRWGDTRADMVGALAVDIAMEEHPSGRGYVRLRETVDAPWPPTHGSGGRGHEVCAHEFHYSRICNVQTDLTFAYEVTRGYGLDGKNDGIVYRNTLASYSHLRDTRQNRWTHRFMAHVERCRLAR